MRNLTIKMMAALCCLFMAMTLSACGGGGGGSGLSKPGIDVIEGTALEGGNAATATPSAGSVVQSSNRDGTTNVTTDTVDVTVDSAEDTFSIVKGVASGADGLTFTVSATDTTLYPCTARSFASCDNYFAEVRHDEDGDGTADGYLGVDFYVSDLADPASGVAAQHGPTCGVGESVTAGQTCSYEIGGESFEFRVRDDGLQGCLAVVSMSCVGGVIDLTSIPLVLDGVRLEGFQATRSGTTWTINALPTGTTEIHTDPTPAPQPTTPTPPPAPRLPAEWLAGGIWWYLPDDVEEIGDIEFGVFIEGQDPFETASIAGLSGSATYNGDAGGIRIEQYATADVVDEILGESEYFDADVSIMADFDANTIEGTINNFDFDDPSDRRTLTLGNTAIPTTGTNIGFFTGMVTDAAVEADANRTGSGNWGGQFFEDGNAVTDLPGAVGGTFGFREGTGATGTATEVIIGVFGAER